MIIDFELLRVADVRHVRDHVLWLRFNDGVEGHVNFASRLGRRFESLRDPGLFAQARIVGDLTVEWPNGTDVHPEDLYEWLEVTGPVQKRNYRELKDAAARDELAQVAAMPELSRFYGIVIRMIFSPNALPLFFAHYGNDTASIEIRSGRVDTRGFPGRALRLALEWRELHQRELLENWERMGRNAELLPIEPLE